MKNEPALRIMHRTVCNFPQKRGAATTVSANGNHILPIALHDAEQQLAAHMELKYPAYCKTSHHALTFASLSQSRQERRKKSGYFFPTEC